MLPCWLCLGTQKGGTTTLQQLLGKHPQVFLPTCKEVHYFSLHYSRGLPWYQSHYATAEGRCCGDITPYYLFHPQAPWRIQALLPQARLVVLLRDPVARTLSQYFHAQRLGFEPLPLAEALAAEAERLQGSEPVLEAADGRHHSHQEHSYLARSRYELQLRRYEALFAPDQLLLLRSEDLFAQPEATLQRITHFLALEPLTLPSGAMQPANAGCGEASGVDAEALQNLRQALAPTYATMAERYGITWP